VSIDQTGLPPHDLEAEQSVLGGMLLSPAAIADVLDVMAIDDLYKPAHQSIGRAMLALFWRNEPVDPVTVAAELERRGELTRAGGAPYLHTLIETVPRATNATYYAEIVVKKSKLRRLLEAGTRILQLGRSDAAIEDIDQVIENARQTIDKVASDQRGSGDQVDLEIAFAEFLEELDSPAPPSLPTGLYDLDDVLSGGLYPGQLVVVGARPGVGKSVMGLGWAVHAAKSGRGVLFASLEMSKSDCMCRLVASEGQVELTNLIKHTLSPDDWRRATKVSEEASSWPLRIDARPTQTLTTIRSAARDMTRRPEPFGLVVVDYLQLMTDGRRAERRDLEIGGYTRGLKLLAKELGVPVVAISQVNRGSDKREDKRPTMTDLRESGSIEADADTVILLHRDPANPTEIEAIVAKQRQGPTKSVALRWRGHYSRIDSIASRHLEAV
jgi:replicative DNA helicase